MVAQEVQTTESVSSTDIVQQDTNELAADKEMPRISENGNNLFKLHSFTGDYSKSKLSNWIKMYERYSKRFGWTETDMLENFAMYLEQDAFDYFVSYVMVGAVDWKTAKEAMMKRFEQYDVEPFMEFLSIKFNHQMGLKEYFKKMRGLGMAAGLNEEDIITGLTKGLPAHLRSEMASVITLQQWVAVAFCLEQRLEAGHHNNHNKHQSWKNNKRHNRNHRQNKPRNNNQQQNTNQSEAITTTSNIEQIEVQN